MRAIFLILSVMLVLTACASCKKSDIFKYPDEVTYSTDITNGVCVEWVIYDKKNVKFKRVKEMPLEVGGPCDHMMGYSFRGLKVIQNWLRDL